MIEWLTTSFRIAVGTLSFLLGMIVSAWNTFALIISAIFQVATSAAAPAVALWMAMRGNVYRDNGRIKATVLHNYSDGKSLNAEDIDIMSEEEFRSHKYHGENEQVRKVSDWMSKTLEEGDTVGMDVSHDT